jgi:predicted metal-binding transcription factor (methanogenesis marker protein 9)
LEQVGEFQQFLEIEEFLLVVIRIPLRRSLNSYSRTVFNNCSTFGALTWCCWQSSSKELLIVGRQVHKVAVSGDEWAKPERAIVTLKSI